MMNRNTHGSECQDYAEVDPTGRYGRYNEILGKGASKTVFKAFDEYEGIEVAWNQVKLNEFLHSPEDLERLYCEIHLLKTLKHKNIMKFYSSWVDTSKRKINFVTEMFTSGTLRQYRQKHRRVNIRVVKDWCRQILGSLLYLHSHDPPIIHRDLKCDNIFINGNQREVKIGDLGLAAILRKPLADHCVGTPEFMAPEVYEEAYNELVDIYSFGMCVLEMVTFEYPYSECTHPAQIYKKVISGTKPDAFYNVKDPKVRDFIDKCIAKVSERLSAKELLNDPFLLSVEQGLSFGEGGITDMVPFMRQPSHSPISSFRNGSLYTCGVNSDGQSCDMMLENLYEGGATLSRTRTIKCSHRQNDEPCANLDITTKGIMKEDGKIFLRLGILDREGHLRNIYFAFNPEADTALGVAAEMVAELNIADHDVSRIAKMIDSQVFSLAPECKPHPNIERTPGYLMPSFRDHKHEISSMDSCSHHDNALYSRFTEIADDDDRSEDRVTESSQTLSSSQSVSLYISDSEEEEHSPPSMPEDHATEIHRKPMRIRSFVNLESSDFKRKNKIAIPSTKETIKSFHLGTNFSFRISLQDDAAKPNLNKDSTIFINGNQLSSRQKSRNCLGNPCSLFSANFFSSFFFRRM